MITLTRPQSLRHALDVIVRKVLAHPGYTADHRLGLADQYDICATHAETPEEAAEWRAAAARLRDLAPMFQPPSLGTE